ncbi:MAG: DUF2330 domain-containing protein [Planctomycetota bacterium]
MKIARSFLWIALIFSGVSNLIADPCGMVPPIWTGPGVPIQRIGLQQTYVFFDQGVESFVIRPGFRGKVDNFGMLIPFPSAPAIRKVPDNVFAQVANAIDPPEIVVDLNPRLEMLMNSAGPAAPARGLGIQAKKKRSVRVIKQEAVGMYEVAVLEAGSPAALKRWMDQNRYQYPDGMDQVVADYVDQGWCFVAVKTRVGSKAQADPKPGQRQVNPQMPVGGLFDGSVQGLGFRFKTEELVVPMRLSAFNEGDLRNVVYLLTRGGKKIRSIPEEFVMRQVSGKQLVKHLTQPLPLRIIGGTFKDIPDYRKKRLADERKPGKVNGVAKSLFVSDVTATEIDGYSHEFEEQEKEILQVGEHFLLRGPEIDSLMEQVSEKSAQRLVNDALPKLEQMTMTVVDGDFPRQVIASQNLTFQDFQMAASRNRPESYDTKIHRPGGKKEGVLLSEYSNPQIKNKQSDSPKLMIASIGMLGILVLSLGRFRNVD